MEEKGVEMALSCAYQFGAEACANHGGVYPDADSRYDIAIYYGVEKWADIPEDHKKQMVAKHAEGWHAEKRHHAGNTDDR